MLKKTVLVLAAALVLGPAVPANAASIVGSQIQGAYYFPDDVTLYGGFSYSVNPFVVGAGVESVLTVDGSNSINVDFDATSLVLTFLGSVNWTAAAFNGPQFVVLAGTGFDPVSSVIASGGQSVSAAVVGGVLQINWQGQTFLTGQNITLEFADAEVPEPASLLLFGTGLAALAVRLRRRKTA